MSAPQTRSQVIALLKQHHLVPDKRLGQHFLVDPNITRKIASFADVRPGDRVVEIGPGTGTLTSALIELGARVTAIEMDESLRPLLEQVTDADLIFADAADMDLHAVLMPGEWTLVSNLPYNVGTSITLDALRRAPQIKRFVVMVQQEVAERLTAEPGGKEYGIPSVVVSLHGLARMVLKVPPQVFFPPPRVGSAVVVIERRAPHPLTETAIDIAGVAFNQRRKMLRKSLTSIAGDAEALVFRAGLDPTARPEDLDPTDFIRLADAAHG